MGGNSESSRSAGSRSARLTLSDELAEQYVSAPSCQLENGMGRSSDIKSCSARSYDTLPVPQKAGLDVTKPRGKRGGYAQGLVSDEGFERHGLSGSSSVGSRYMVASRVDHSGSKVAGKTSWNIARHDNSQYLVSHSSKKAAICMPPKYTDPISHRYQWLAQCKAPEPKPEGLEDAAGLSSKRLPFMQCHWIIHGHGVSLSEFTPHYKVDPISHTEDMFARTGAGADQQRRLHRQSCRLVPGQGCSYVTAMHADPSKSGSQTQQQLPPAAVMDCLGNWSNPLHGCEDMRPWALRSSVEPTMEYLAENNRTMLQPFERAENTKPSGNRKERGWKRGGYIHGTSAEMLDCIRRDAIDNRCHPGPNATAHQKDTKKELLDTVGNVETTPRCLSPDGSMVMSGNSICHPVKTPSGHTSLNTMSSMRSPGPGTPGGHRTRPGGVCSPSMKSFTMSEKVLLGRGRHKPVAT